MKNEVEQKVFDCANPIVEPLGYELVDVEYGNKENGKNLTVFIHKQGGITLDDCQLVAKALDEPLDELNPTNDEHYYFNVSSVGLDRPLKTTKDFLRNLGKEVNVVYNVKDNKKTITATVHKVENEVVTFNQKGKLIEIQIKDMVKVTPAIKF